MYTSRTTSILLVTFLTILMSFSASSWDVEAAEEPHINLQVSNNSQFYGLAEVTDSDGDPVDFDRLQDDNAELGYYYNMSEDNASEMNYFGEGWYYDSFTVNTTAGDEVLYELEDDSSGGFQEEDIHELEFGDLNVELLTDFSEPLLANSTREVEVNVTNSDNEPVEDIDVEITFTDFTDVHEEEIRHYDSEEELHYRSRARMPEQEDETFLMHVTAENEDLYYENPFGGETHMVETSPHLRGEVEALDSDSECDQDSTPETCERGANLNTSFEITTSVADEVNLSVQKKMIEGDWETYEEIPLQDEEDLFTGSFEIPEINTSNKTDEIRLQYNASNEQTYFIEDYKLDYESFMLRDTSSSNTVPGDYHVELEVLKPFSLEVIDPERVEGYVEVRDTDEGLIETFDLSDMSYSGGKYVQDIFIPFDSVPGQYSINYVVENIYGQEITENANFNVEDVNQTFYVNQSIDTEINKTGEHTRELSVENLLSEDMNLTSSVDSDLEDFISLEEDYEIGGDATETIDLTFNIDHVEFFSGEIEFEDNDSGYTQTTDIENQAPVCDQRDGALCVTYNDINGTVYEADESDTAELDVKYLGLKDNETDVNTDVDGALSNHLSLDPVNTTLTEGNDVQNFVLDYSTDSPENLTGSLEVSMNGDSVEIPLELTSYVEPQDAEITVLTDTIDLGEVVEGEDLEEDLEIENTGDVEVESLDYSSTSYNVGGGSSSIKAGETVEETIEFTGVDSDTGTVTIEAETSEETVSDSVDVEAETYADYGEQSDDLEVQASDLDSQIDDEELQSRLSDVQTQIPDISTEFSSGNYEEAQTLYNDLDSELESIEMELQSQNGQGQNGAQPPEEDGGIPFLPIVLGLFVILVIGFIAYTSVIPEEGDPLYSVLNK